MNWEAVGALGEVGGAIGVVATLVYLSLQIRQNSAVTRAQTRAQISLFADRIIESYLSNEQLIRIAQKVRQGQELTDEEKAVRAMQIRRVFRNAEHSFYQYRIGTYEAGEFEGESNTFARTLASPEHRSWWDDHRAEFSRAFQSEVDRIHRQDGNVDPPAS